MRNCLRGGVFSPSHLKFFYRYIKEGLEYIIK